MPIKITRQSDAIDVEHIVLMMYGQAGCWKTSTGFTAKNPLLLDTDNGSHRSAFRKDVVKVAQWSDIASITAEDLKEYDTLVLDTVGRALDMLARHIMSGNSSMGYNGSLSLQGFGALKAQFAAWVKVIQSLGKDIVFIAHDREERRGEEQFQKPDIQGGSYGEIFKIADAVGFVHFTEIGNTLDFNPSMKWEGKNTAQLEPIKIPDFNLEPDFLAKILVQIKAEINTMSKDGKMIADMVTKERDLIDKIDSPDGLNEAVQRSMAMVKAAQLSVKRLIYIKGQALGAVFDKEKGIYTEAPAEQANDSTQS